MSSLPVETFNQRNQGVPIAETLGAMARMSARRLAVRRMTSLTIAAAFGCPSQGSRSIRGRPAPSPPNSRRRMRCGRGIALADTIGVAAPGDVPPASPAWGGFAGPGPCARISTIPANTVSPMP